MSVYIYFRLFKSENLEWRRCSGARLFHTLGPKGMKIHSLDLSLQCLTLSLTIPAVDWRGLVWFVRPEKVQKTFWTNTFCSNRFSESCSRTACNLVVTDVSLCLIGLMISKKLKGFSVYLKKKNLLVVCSNY